MIADPRVLVTDPGEQVVEDGPVQLSPPRTCDRLRDGLAGQLVAERGGPAVALEQPGQLAGGQVVGRAADGVQQVDLGPVRHDGGEVEQRPRGHGQPGGAAEDGRADRVGHATDAGQQLGDEERVARGEPVDPVGVEVGAGREAAYLLVRQRPDVQPGAAREGRQVAEHLVDARRARHPPRDRSRRARSTSGAVGPGRRPGRGSRRRPSAGPRRRRRSACPRGGRAGRRTGPGAAGRSRARPPARRPPPARSRAAARAVATPPAARKSPTAPGRPRPATHTPHGPGWSSRRRPRRRPPRRDPRRRAPRRPRSRG